MYVYEYGLKNFNLKYQPYGRVTVFNDTVQVIDDEYNIKVTGFGVYVHVELNETDNTATLVTNDKEYAAEQYSAIIFEDYLSKIYAFQDNGEKRKINGFGETERLIVWYRNKYFAFITEFDIDSEVIITAPRLSDDELNEEQRFRRVRRRVLAPILEGVEEKLKNEDASIIFMISDDGVKLERAYQTVNNLLENEIVIFIENNKGTNLTGTVFRIKTGSGIKEGVNLPYRQLAYLCALYKVDITKKQFRKVIKKHLKRKDSNFWYYIRKGLEILEAPATWSLDGTAFLLDTATEVVHYFKVENPNYWRAHDNEGNENPDYDPFLIGYDFVKSLQKEIDKTDFEGMFVEFDKKVDALEQELLKGVEALEIDILVDFAKTNLKGVFFLFNQVKNFVRNVFLAAANNIQNTFIFINALIIGIYNSLVDLVIGILQLLSLVCKGVSGAIKLKHEFIENGGTYFSMFLEMFENTFENFINLFSYENITAFLDFIVETAKTTYAFISNPIQAAAAVTSAIASKVSDISFTAGQIGYGIGYVIGFIITEILLAIATGGAKTIATALQVSAKGYLSLLKGTAKAGKLIFKGAKNTGKFVVKGVIQVGAFSIDVLLELLKGIRGAIQNFPKLLQKLATWYNELLAGIKANLIASKQAFTLDPVSATILSFLKASGKAKLAKAGVTYGKSGDEFVIIYKNVIIQSFKTEKEFVAGLKAIIKQPKKNVASYLDDLVKKIGLERRIIASKKQLSKFIEGLRIKPKEYRPTTGNIIESKNIRSFAHNLKNTNLETVINGYHPLVKKWVNRAIKNAEWNLPTHHGLCSEIVNVSKILWQHDRKGVFTLKQAKELFKDSFSHTKKIRGKNSVNHGEYIPACDSCNPFLKYFDITEIK